MKIYSEYKDYQEYVDIQTETNKAKIDVVWVSEIEVIQLYNYIANKYSDEIHYVMCHGARNGTEVKYFTESLPNNWVVEGNDISETANAYEWTENLNNEPLASDPLSINLEELAEMCNDYASVVNTLDTGMNRTVRYKGTDEILRQLKIYYLELKR